MPELGTPGSVRGVLSNGHPYRNPRPTTARCEGHKLLRLVQRLPACVLVRSRGGGQGQASNKPTHAAFRNPRNARPLSHSGKSNKFASQIRPVQLFRYHSCNRVNEKVNKSLIDKEAQSDECGFPAVCR